MVQVGALGLQVAQLQGGTWDAGIGLDTQYLYGLVEVTVYNQQMGQPQGGIPDAGIGGAPVQRDGAAVPLLVSGTVREPGSVGGVADMSEDGVPGAGGQAGVAAFTADVLDQVVRSDVPGDLAHASPRGAEGGDGAVQLAGGIGESLLEPVIRGFGETSVWMPHVGVPCLGLDETGQDSHKRPFLRRWPER